MKELMCHAILTALLAVVLSPVGVLAGASEYVTTNTVGTQSIRNRTSQQTSSNSNTQVTVWSAGKSDRI